MQTSDLQELAHRTRFMREAGAALMLCAIVLGVFLLVPHGTSMATVATGQFSTATDTAFENIHVHAKAAIVYDLTNDKILYAKNVDAQLPLASLTTLLAEYAMSSGTSSVADGVPTTAMLANAASSLGLVQTYVLDAQGHDVSPTMSSGYGSAHDLAILAGALARKTSRIATNDTSPDVPVPGVLFSKTSSSPLAGNNLALVFDAGIGHPVAVIVLGSSAGARTSDGALLAAAVLAHFAQ